MIVITKVSEPETGGNLATALTDLWVKAEIPAVFPAAFFAQPPLT